MNQKGIAPLFILLSVVILVSVGVGAYYFGAQSTTTKEPIESIKTIQTENESTPSSITNTPHLPSSSPKYTPSVGNTNIEQYTSTTYNYSLEYPKTWNLSRTNDSEGSPQVIIKPSSTGSTALYIAINSPYSTSGAICANQDCTPTSKISGTVNGQSFSTDVVNVNGENRFMIELPYKKVTVQGYSEPVSLNIYGSYKNDSEKATILSILSSLKY